MSEFYRITEMPAFNIKKQAVFQIILLLLSICTLASCGKKDEDLIVNERIPIDLMETDEYAIFEKTMILFDNQQYTAKTPVSFFIQGYEEIDYTGYLQKINTISDDAQKRSILYTKDYFDEGKLPYLFADFLENGKCYVYDKKAKEPVLEIEMERWSHFPAPLAGSAGRKFL
jgi:hypothetical protein